VVNSVTFVVYESAATEARLLAEQDEVFVGLFVA